MRSRFFFISLLMLLIFGWVLSGLEAESLWMDEGYSAWLVRDEMRLPDSARDMLRYVRDSFASSFERLRLDVHPPLYYLMLDGWTLLIGHSVFALRLLSALMAVVGLAATYAFGANLFNKRAGLMALLLLGTSSFFVYYSREARSYGLYLALAMLASLSYWRFWRKVICSPQRISDLGLARLGLARQTPTLWLHTDWARVFAYIFFASALLYTHYTGVVVLVAHGLFLPFGLLNLAPEKRLNAFLKSLLGFACIGLIFGAWWFLFGMEQFRINTSIEAAGALPSDWNTIAALWLLLTIGMWGWFAGIFVFSRLNPLSWFFGANTREKLPVFELGFLLLLGFVPPIILLLANAYGLAIFQMRYLIAIVPIWALLVAYALSELWFPFLRNRQVLGAISLILLIGLVYQQVVTYRWFWPEKPRWEDASQLASDAREPLDPALVYLDERSPFAYYADEDGLLNGLSIRLGWREFAPQEIQEIGASLDNSDTAWAFVAMQAPESWDAVAALSEGRGVGYRDAVQWTIYYRFDRTSDEGLSFNFGELLDYQSTFYRRYQAAVGESLCVPVRLQALGEVAEDYSIGLHLTRGYNEVVAQVDEGLGGLAAGEQFERDLCLSLPETGNFHLRLVIYEWRDPLQRLPVLERDLLWGDYLMAGIVEVE